MITAKDLVRSGYVVAALMTFAGLHPLPSAAQGKPESVVESFHQTLVDTMKSSRSLGPKGRFAALEPALARCFDMTRITRTVAGSSWERLSAEQQTRLTVAFERFEAAQFADTFDGYQGQRFRTVSIRSMPDGGFLVATIMEAESRPSVRFDYTIHPGADGWKIDDLRFDGWLSVMDRRSAEFKEILRRRGVDTLVAGLERHTQIVLDRVDDLRVSHLADLRPGTWPVQTLALPIP